ncbi:MAG: MerR family transcriptional regulator [Desulfobacteraceae bacterium]|nr:MAG: MerR family transcriptional regulator [Desulfobacteraceae bacterium]
MKNRSKWFRIAELEKISDIPRRTIHFYLQKGLLHPPTKTGKTMSYYDDSHIKKLAFIKKAKSQGLPLIAIQAEIESMQTVDPEAFGETAEESPSQAIQKEAKNSKPRKTQGIKTRESILDVGCRLFREKGYKETKISDVVKAMNVGKGTFYFYFSDKRELLLECVPRIFSELFSEGWERLRKIKNPLERLEQRAKTVLPVLSEFCSIIQLSKEAMEDPDPKLQYLGEQTYLSIRSPLESDIEKSIAGGLIKKIDPKIAATFLIGAMESLNYLPTIEKNVHPNSFWDDYLSLITNGIRGR